MAQSVRGTRVTPVPRCRNPSGRGATKPSIRRQTPVRRQMIKPSGPGVMSAATREGGYGNVVL